MTVILQPKVTINILGANTVVPNDDQKILFVGQQTTGSSDSGTLIEDIQENTEGALFGPSCMLSAMLRNARNENRVNRFDAIVLDDNGSGVPATGTMTTVGTATETSSFDVVVGSENEQTFTITVTSGDTATIVGDSIVAAVALSATSAAQGVNSTGVVTFTAENDGTLGNFIGLQMIGSVAGLTFTVGAMSGGATDPVLTNLFDAIGDTRYQAVVWPYFEDTSVLNTFLSNRFDVDNNILDGEGFTSSVDSLANNLSRLNALNELTLIDFTDKLEVETLFTGPAQAELPYVKSSMFAAIRSLRLTEGESITKYVISSNGALDSFGGAALASKPYFNTSLPNLPIIGTGRGWTDTEIEQLFDAGGSVLGNNVTGTNVLAGEVITTYKTDTAGNPDISFKFLNYVDTASGAREYFSNNLRKRFAQSRLTLGDVQRGRDMANKQVIIAYCEKLYQDLSGPGFVLLESGEDAQRFFKENIIVVIDKTIGRATITMVVPIVTQLRELLATMQIAFSTEA